MASLTVIFFVAGVVVLVVDANLLVAMAHPRARAACSLPTEARDLSARLAVADCRLRGIVAVRFLSFFEFFLTLNSLYFSSSIPVHVFCTICSSSSWLYGGGN